MIRCLLLLILATSTAFSQKEKSLDEMTFILNSVDSCGVKIDFETGTEPILRTFEYGCIRKMFSKHDGHHTLKSLSDNVEGKYWVDIKIYFAYNGEFVKLYWPDMFKVTNNLVYSKPQLSNWLMYGIDSSGTFLQKDDELLYKMTKMNYSGERICINLIFKISDQ